MRDDYLRAHFELSCFHESALSEQEKRRVQMTLALVPDFWVSVIDVGCGDGRISHELLDRGLEVVGIDWSESSIKHFAGNGVVADIRRPWPMKKAFDGAICAEVLEHFSMADVREVVSNVQHFTRHGFVVSVPAREPMPIHFVRCFRCGAAYHLWGHVQRFESFEDVDVLVGKESCQRVHISSYAVRPSLSIDRWRRQLGYYPYSDSALCPFCGTRLLAPERKISFCRLFLLWSLDKLEKITGFLRQERGWFVCRYDK